ncbi:Late embryogenesis abundant protein, LEA_2 subgroup [Dillenia turbinata]|uniref:Late embryogenesis abundant protein, LEA_2 subgroup n=1 Tax=Dillenia turbinata TaxID=194707 RepID=A0AAN8WFI1_9MAGN
MGAIALTFSLIVFRIAAPNLNLQSVVIKNLKFNSSSSPPYLNMTFIAEIHVKNDNFGTFKFQNSSAGVFYNGTLIGTSGFFGGEVRGRETQNMNVTIKVRSNVWVNQTYLNGDLNSGLVKLRSYADFRGKVTVLKIAKQSKVSVLDCTMNLNLTSKAIQDILCAEN